MALLYAVFRWSPAWDMCPGGMWGAGRRDARRGCPAPEGADNLHEARLRGLGASDLSSGPTNLSPGSTPPRGEEIAGGATRG